MDIDNQDATESCTDLYIVSWALKANTFSWAWTAWITQKALWKRLLAVEYLLEEHPWYLEKIAFVQIAAPSRTRIPSYVGSEHR